MFKAIKEFFFGKPVPAPKLEEVVSAPYKVEATPIPVVTAKKAAPKKQQFVKAPVAKAKAPVAKKPVAKKPAAKPLAKAGDVKKPAAKPKKPATK